jgi:hypothetical protein
LVTLFTQRRRQEIFTLRSIGSLGLNRPKI